jgi:hypothetical protein
LLLIESRMKSGCILALAITLGCQPQYAYVPDTSHAATPTLTEYRMPLTQGDGGLPTTATPYVDGTGGAFPAGLFPLFPFIQLPMGDRNQNPLAPAYGPGGGNTPHP